MDKSEYFNLIENDLNDLEIVREDNFNCGLYDSKGIKYKGFLLSQSDEGNAYTICDIDFQKSATDDKYQPRLTIRRTNKDLQDMKVRSNVYFQRISFDTGQDGYREFWTMIAFLHKFRDIIDLGEFNKEFKVYDTEAYVIEFDTKDEADQIKTLAKLFGKLENPDKVIESAKDNIKKEALKIFYKLLNDVTYFENYKIKYRSEILGTGDEAVWHHFLKNNDWILGLNVDVKFIHDFIPEANVGTPDTNGKGSPENDLLGLADYTELVELKTHKTPIFTNKKQQTARANTWSFSPDFIDGISQCLAQKTEWEKKHRSKDIIDEKNQVIDQDLIRTLDPAVIFIIGSKNREFPDDSKDKDIHIKRDTFRRFRRDSRNIKIITYDELYERAYFMVHDKKPDPINPKVDDLEIAATNDKSKSVKSNLKKEKDEFDNVLEITHNSEPPVEKEESIEDALDLDGFDEPKEELPF